MSVIATPHTNLNNPVAPNPLREKSTHKGYFLGIDGGGTKTQAIVTDADFTVLGKGDSGAANPIRVGFDEAVKNIENAVAIALKGAGITVEEITAACFGIAGISHPIHYHNMKDKLDRKLGIENLELVTDARIALTGALGGKPGVIVIAGTGSIAFGINEAGEEARAGGWGPTYSDEGSGYDIARHALKAIAASSDGRSQQTLLTEMIYRELGINNVGDLPSVIYTDEAKPARIAELAEVVAEAANQGDQIAQDILERAGIELGKMAIAVIERLGIERQAFRVACVGSVFKSGKFLEDPFRRTVLAFASGAEIGDPLHSPEMGAIQLAEILSKQG
jgi:N-acetylglucosamine kinase-like BadF-type ATPase